MSNESGPHLCCSTPNPGHYGSKARCTERTRFAMESSGNMWSESKHEDNIDPVTVLFFYLDLYSYSIPVCLCMTKNESSVSHIPFTTSAYVMNIVKSRLFFIYCSPFSQSSHSSGRFQFLGLEVLQFWAEIDPSNIDSSSLWSNIPQHPAILSGSDCSFRVYCGLLQINAIEVSMWKKNRGTTRDGSHGIVMEVMEVINFSMVIGRPEMIFNDGCSGNSTRLSLQQLWRGRNWPWFPKNRQIEASEG